MDIKNPSYFDFHTITRLAHARTTPTIPWKTHHWIHVTMADLHEDDDNEHRSAIQNNQFPHHLHEFDVDALDLDSSSSQDVFHRRFERLPLPNSSLHQVNSQTHMFHQGVLQPQPQPHSASRSIEENCLFNSDCSFRVIEENDHVISNEFEAGFGAESGFLLENSDNPNCDDDANSGFMVADFWGRFLRSESGDSSDPGENEAVDGDCDEEASFHLCWDAFHLEDEITSVNPNPNQNSNSNANANANEDSEWEEVDDRIDERETLSMFFGAEPDDDASVSPVILTGFQEPSEEHNSLQWQVLSNVHNFEPNLDSEDQYDEYNYTEYEMFFGQFADSDVSSLGRPPASKTAVVNLSTVLMTEEDVMNNNTLCAVCKDEVVVGEMATQLPCSHRYHGDCILPWLAVRNTCPVCRHELPTDDPDYERRRAERG